MVETTQRYPVDDITQWTPCELQSPFKNLVFIVAYGLAYPGDIYHGQQIPTGYAKVSVEEVRQRYETLEFDIPKGASECKPSVLVNLTCKLTRKRQTLDLSVSAGFPINPHTMYRQALPMQKTMKNN